MSALLVRASLGCEIASAISASGKKVTILDQISTAEFTNERWPYLRKD
jgi:hypothetical protein